MPTVDPIAADSVSSQSRLDDSVRAWKLSWREVVGLILLTLLISIRSWSIAHEHSATWDTIYHLDRAVLFVSGGLEDDRQLNDPPMGEMIIFAPYLIERWFDPEPMLDRSLQLIAIWKSILMLPALTCAFLWARNLYNQSAGWLVVGLICIEPTLAAMTAYATLDSLAIAAIVPAVYIGFLYGQRPTWWRLVALAVATAFALICKHTAAVLLPIGAMQMIMAFVTRRRRKEYAPLGAHFVVGCLIGLISLWLFTGLDYSPAARTIPGETNIPGFRLTTNSLPAGVYFRSLSDASLHAAIGHPAFLWGETGRQGWWYYYFVLFAYKAPLGFFVLALIALLSARRNRAEIGLLIPIACYAVFCMTSTIAIGFRHALPLEVFLLIAIGRVMLRGRIVQRIAWIILGLTIIHITWWHPNYLSFINAPREKIWMKISDSNLDWGQGLKQVQSWIESKRAGGDNRPISLIYFGSPDVLRGRDDLPNQLPDDLHVGYPDHGTGMLITTPIAVSGQYEEPRLPAGFQRIEPIEIIGDSMLVFDLDDPQTRLAIEGIILD